MFFKCSFQVGGVKSFDILFTLQKEYVKFLKRCFRSKIDQKYRPYLQRYLNIYQALLYIKWNLPILTITNPNGFKIGPSTTVIRGVSKVSWTLNNPVLLHQLFLAKSQAKYLHHFRASASNQLTPSCRWGQDWKSSWIPHQSLSTYVFTDFDIRKNLDIM